MFYRKCSYIISLRLHFIYKSLKKHTTFNQCTYRWKLCMHTFAHMLDKDLNSLLNCLPDPPGHAANQQLLINQFLKRKKKKIGTPLKKWKRKIEEKHFRTKRKSTQRNHFAKDLEKSLTLLLPPLKRVERQIVSVLFKGLQKFSVHQAKQWHSCCSFISKNKQEILHFHSV